MAAMLEGPNNKNICIKIEFIFQRDVILLFHSSNMVAVNTLYNRLPDIKNGSCVAISNNI